jgi:hypothetical protein
MLLARLLVTAAPLAFVPSRLLAQAKTPVAVFKDPSCGCCEKWVAHLTANGFAVTVTNTSDMTSVNARYKVPAALESCHTATVANYVIVGHVPAADVRRLLAEKPAGVVGLTIPGMPASAPGMDMAPFQPYTVLAFDAKGATTGYARHTKA